MFLHSALKPLNTQAAFLIQMKLDEQVMFIFVANLLANKEQYMHKYL